MISGLKDIQADYGSSLRSHSTMSSSENTYRFRDGAGYIDDEPLPSRTSAPSSSSISQNLSQIDAHTSSSSSQAETREASSQVTEAGKGVSNAGSISLNSESDTSVLQANENRAGRDVSKIADDSVVADLEDAQIVQRALELHNLALREDEVDVFKSEGEGEEEADGSFDSLEEDEDWLDNEEEQDDEVEEEDFDVDNEDWEVAAGDFTKQYNKLKAEGAIRSGVASTSSTPLPVRNFRPKASLRNRHTAENTNGTTASGPSSTPTTTAQSSPAPRLGVASAPKNPNQYANQKDKADRATVEQVLDARTWKVLNSFIRKGVMGGVEGCVSTGKEANVYFGPPPPTPPVSTSSSVTYPDPYPSALALKIYKTSILSFRTRGQYIQGEHRFRNAYSKVTNPRKMVKVWAEKELRNLRRLREGGIRCPVVIEVRENVLVMEFLGTPEGKTSPRLKDAEIDPSRLADLYAEILVAMRRLYQRCRLIHADLSEYNILYHNDHLYIIDVSQSVEHDHPSAFDFLRADIRNMDDFFRKRSSGEVRTLGIKGTFDFIVNERLKTREGVEVQESEDEERLVELVRNWLANGVGLEQDTAFMESYIPRNLGEVVDPERDIDAIARGEGKDLIYAGVTGLQTDAQVDSSGFIAGEAWGHASVKPITEASIKESAAADSTGAGEAEPRPVNGDDDESYSSSSDSGDEDASSRPRGFRHEDKEAKKERKKALKEDKREKRKTKMPKAEKKKRIKASGGKK